MGIAKKINVRKATILAGFNSLAKESVVMYEPILIDLATQLMFRGAENAKLPMQTRYASIVIIFVGY